MLLMRAVVAMVLVLVVGAAYAQQGGAAKAGADSSKAAAVPTVADPLVHRLILKDGSFQLVSKYEFRGDRVRYVSAERGGDWEEIPSSLVDWAATDTYAKQHSGESPVADRESGSPNPGGSQVAAEIDAEERADRNRNYEVAPNLRLPDETGIWALDTFHDGLELVEVQQNSGQVGEQSGHNVVRSVLNSMGGTKQVIELNERHAKPALHEPDPVFFVSIDEDSDEPGVDALTVDTHGAGSQKHPASGSAATSQYIIVRAQVMKDYRIVGPLKVSGPSENVTLTKAEMLPGKRWMKLTPLAPLAAGDWVLMEKLSGKEVNLAVWDFRVDAGAGDNPNAILPLQR